MIKIENCPVCGSNNIRHFLTVKDHSISQEVFNLDQCQACTFTFTNPIPTEQEIGKYYQSEDYVSHSDSKKGLINVLYHYVRKINLKAKYDIISKHHTKGTLLDVGCGTGYFLKYAQDEGWEVEGMEPDPGARKLAETNTKKNIAADLDHILDKQYDVITLWHVLEHIHNLKDAIQKINAHLKKDGTLIIAVPNLNSYDAKLYKEKWAAYDVPRHLYHFTPETIKTLLLNNGFTLADKKPMVFDSYYVSLLSEKYKRGKQDIIGFIKAVMNGFTSNFKSNSSLVNNSSIIYIAKKQK